VAPRSQRGRPHVLAPSSVREVLHQESYRGLVVWNKTKKRDAWGQTEADQSAGLGLDACPAEELRIVSDALWKAAGGN
jgi:hypothetical protein